MLETTKPLNVYCSSERSVGESGYASPVSGDGGSRRNSMAFKEYVRNRRFTMLSRTNRISVPVPLSNRTERHSGGEGRKVSNDSQLGDEIEEDDDWSPQPVYQRRMSVPEKTFRSMDYAILRPSNEGESRFEIVAAFDRHTDPYRHYMQSISCYDLAPSHGAVVMIDGALKVHKALTALCQSGHNAAVVCNLQHVKGGLAMLTETDCLRAILLASTGVTEVAEQTVGEYLGSFGNKKQLISADMETSVWDAARLIVLNHVHRIPIVELDDTQQTEVLTRPQGDVMYLLNLNRVLTDTVLKLSDPKLSLGPHVKQRSLKEAKIGTWHDIYTVHTESDCREVVNMFLEKKISCVPVVDDHRRVVGVLGKGDVMRELRAHPVNYLEVLDITVEALLAGNAPMVYCSPTMTVLDATSQLIASERQSVPILDVDHKLMAIVSVSDIMDYIQNSADIHHKMSIA